MTGPLATAEDLAKQLRISEELAKRLSRRDEWPHVQFSTRTIRYTEAHVEEIIAKYEKAGTVVVESENRFGQTSRSKAKSA